jgi:hypothetical protein
LFTALREQHGAVEIGEIWQRPAARALAEVRFGEAVAAFDQADAITWTDDQTAARKPSWRSAPTHDTASEPDATCFVFAYTNCHVNTLNAEPARCGVSAESWPGQRCGLPQSMCR